MIFCLIIKLFIEFLREKILGISRFRLATSSLFLSEVSIFYLLRIFIGPFDIEKLFSRDRLFILDITVTGLGPDYFYIEC